MPAYDLNGKVALVTGAARGIGYETARQLHLRGASVTVLDIDAAEAREAAERIGPRAIGLATDVTDHSAVTQSVAETVDRFGGLDVVVANAGIAQKQMATVRGIGVEEWERVFEVDMLGVWRTVRAALPQVVERQGPHRRHLLGLRLRQRHAQQPLRRRQVGRRVAGPLAAGRADAAGASASVAYFGWVDTKMVQDAVAANGDRMQQNLPEFLRKRITPDQAGAAVVRGIEERAPRIFAPKWWRYVSAFRGLINPLLDGRMDSDRRVLTTIREVEAEADEQGAAAVAAAKSDASLTS